MPFEVVSGVGRGMGVLGGGGDRRRGRDRFGVNLGRHIVTNGAFATRLFSNYFEDLLLLLTRSIANTARGGLLLRMSLVAWFVCLWASVCVCVTVSKNG